VTADGYAPLRIVQRTLLRPEFLKFTVEMARAASVRGIVVDDENKPMTGVKVRPLIQLSSNGNTYDDGLHYGPFEVSTDDAGRFELKELPKGYVQLYAHAPDFYFTNYQITYDVPSTQIVLQLRRAGSVSVAVTGKDGKQLSRYENNPLIVNLDPKGEIPVGPGSSMATVNAAGICEFNDVPPGEYRISSRPNPGHKSPTYPPDQIITVTAGKRTSIKVVYE
jgi:hypothetical protein